MIMKMLVVILVVIAIPSLFFLGLQQITASRDILPQYRDHIGKAVAGTDPAHNLFGDKQAEVLAYGLEEVTGLAVQSGRVYIAEARRPLLVLEPDNLKNPTAQAWFQCGTGYCDELTRQICHDGVCDAHDSLSVQTAGNTMLFVLDGRIVKGSLNDASGLPTSEQPSKLKGSENITNPAGLWKANSVLFVTADSLPLSNREDRTHTGKLIAVCDGISCVDSNPPHPATGLDRPSGIVALEDFGPIYVAEETGDGVRWSTYHREGSDLLRDGTLAAVPEKHSSGRFLAMAAWRAPQPANKNGAVILAAGPEGLYAFGSDGTNLGRMLFEEPVSGVAVWNDWIYLTVGHLLCRIRDLTFPSLPPIVKPPQPPTPQPTPPGPPPGSKIKRRRCRCGESIKKVARVSGDLDTSTDVSSLTHSSSASDVSVGVAGSPRTQ
jgi:hypothetical protein